MVSMETHCAHVTHMLHRHLHRHLGEWMVLMHVVGMKRVDLVMHDVHVA
jgi:hypothetical protein